MSVTFHITGDFDGPEVNMSNRNAALVLKSLGFDFDYNMCTFDVDDLEGRLILAEMFGGNMPDHGTPNVETTGDQGARMIECGLRPGYFAEKYHELRDVCCRARMLGVEYIVAA